MSARILSVLPLGAALGCALVAGVMFAFSSFVMPGLARMAPPQGIAAMQSINRSAVSSSFLAVFVGTAAICAVVAGAALLDAKGAGDALRIGGAVAYLAGAVAITRVIHVPRNDALDALDPRSVEAAALWPGYIATWTAWNHVRMVAATLAAGALVLSTKVSS